MFEAGKTYKVKVEISPGEVGFGRATILEKSGNQLCIQIRTSKETNKVLAKGTRIWFVSDTTDNASYGLWSSSVLGAQLSGGKTSMVCSTPKLEPVMQRRRTPRVTVSAPVKMSSVNGQQLGSDIRTKDISRSGVALETTQPLPEDIGHDVHIIVEATVGDIPAACRVIRIERNWLANKSVIGLEFTELRPEAVATLDKLLVLLGGKPRHADNASDQKTDADRNSKKGMSGWMQGSKDPGLGTTKNRFVGTGEFDKVKAAGEDPDSGDENDKGSKQQEDEETDDR